jgi:ribonuclease III
VTRPLDELEGRLGVTFVDPDLLVRALTHPSYSLEQGGDDYERLEFLGDAVLAWIVAAHLYEAFPALDEGLLTRMRIALTSGRVLAEVAREIDLGAWMRFGRGAAREVTRDSVLENAFEALVGAVYLAFGPDGARDFVLRWLGGRMDPEALLGAVADAKSRLQEHTQSLGLGLPVYEIVATTGPAHDPRFTAEVSIGSEVWGTGDGASKQDAQQAAALAALRALGAA